MQTFDAASLNAMAQQLTAAADAGEWERLAQLDGMLQRWLRPMQAADATHAEVWHKVAQAHARAIDKCRHAKHEAATQLQGLQDTQAAQQAYAWQEVLA